MFSKKNIISTLTTFLILSFIAILFHSGSAYAANWPKFPNFKVQLNQNKGIHWGKENAQIRFGVYVNGNTERQPASAAITDIGPCDLSPGGGLDWSFYVRELTENDYDKSEKDTLPINGAVVASENNCLSNGNPLRTIRFTLNNGIYIPELDKTVYRATAFITSDTDKRDPHPVTIGPPGSDSEYKRKFGFNLFSLDGDIGFLKYSYLPLDVLSSNGGLEFHSFEVSLMRGCTDRESNGRRVRVKDFDGNKNRNSLISLTRLNTRQGAYMFNPHVSPPDDAGRNNVWLNNGNRTYSPRNVQEDVNMDVFWNFASNTLYRFTATQIATSNFINFQFPLDEFTTPCNAPTATLSSLAFVSDDNASYVKNIQAGPGDKVYFYSWFRKRHANNASDDRAYWERTTTRTNGAPNGNGGGFDSLYSGNNADGWTFINSDDPPLVPNWEGSFYDAEGLGAGKRSFTIPSNAPNGARYCITSNIWADPGNNGTFALGARYRTRWYTTSPGSPSYDYTNGGAGHPACVRVVNLPDTRVIFDNNASSTDYEKGDSDVTVRHQVCNKSNTPISATFRVMGQYPNYAISIPVPNLPPGNGVCNWITIHTATVNGDLLDLQPPGYKARYTTQLVAPEIGDISEGFINVFEVPFAKFMNNDVRACGDDPASTSFAYDDRPAGNRARGSNTNLASIWASLNGHTLRSRLDTLTRQATSYSGQSCEILDEVGPITMSLAAGETNYNGRQVVGDGSTNITINGNIINANNTDVLFIRANNIYISNNATRLGNVVLIATNNIYTCIQGLSPGNVLNRSVWDEDCRNPLQIDGAISAGNRVYLMRTSGTRYLANLNPDYIGGADDNTSPAELFKFPPQFYFMNMGNSDPSKATKYDAIQQLPPRL